MTDGSAILGLKRMTLREQAVDTLRHAITSGERLEGCPHLEQPAKLVLRHLTHQQTPPGRLGEQPLVLEEAHRLAKRAAADL
ncbi:MAG TPA: hypothetical protein VJU58_17435, partial [Microbacterium sp.]|nr:hypothetical protein [Microbacterium sp.]